MKPALLAEMTALAEERREDVLARWRLDEAQPEPQSDAEPLASLRAYILKNDRFRLAKQMPTLRKLRDRPRWSKLLDPKRGGYTYAYRFIGESSMENLVKILGGRAPKDGYYGKRRRGVLTPRYPGVSSWTVHPRSMIYSGFFAVEQRHNAKALTLIRARITNAFVGNPDRLVDALGLPDGTAMGYKLEREVLGWGPIRYDRAVLGARKSQQSIEGLAADLIDLVLPLASIDDDDWTDDYYIPRP